MYTAAAYSVVQQRYLLDSGLLRPGVPHDEVVLGVTRLLAYSFAYQPLWLLLFAWADDVPWFGFSIAGGGDKSWAANTARALECSFAGGCEAALPNFSKPVPVPLFAFIYVVGYVMYYGGLGKFLAGNPTWRTYEGTGIAPLPSPAAPPVCSRPEPRVGHLRPARQRRGFGPHVSVLPAAGHEPGAGDDACVERPRQPAAVLRGRRGVQALGDGHARP